MSIKIETPFTKDKAALLRAGDLVELSGVLYTIRDAAHQRLMELLNACQPLPFELVNSILYYSGACPPRPGQISGSAGPTTSSRMDRYTPSLIELGVTGMIGKGRRSQLVIDSMQEHGAVYFAAIGGTGALLAGFIQSQKVIAFPELGPEAIRELTVKDFPVIVAIDAHGNDLYASEISKYKQK